MSNDTEYGLPAWAPRLRKVMISRFYESSGKGLVDEELINEVGYALLARAESILAATDAVSGRAPCAACGATVEHERQWLECAECEWRCPWEAYRKTIKYKHLFAGRMKSQLEEFVRRFSAARSPRERLILIDTLIHRYHGESGRPGVCSIIEGKLSNIMSFLDALSYGSQTPPDVESTREEWRKKWYSHPWKERVEQMIAQSKRGRESPSVQPQVTSKAMVLHFTAEDTDRFRRIRMKALQNDPDAFGETAEAFAERSDAELTQWLSDAVTAHSKSIAYFEHEGEPIAMCGFGISDEDPSSGYLWGLFVSPAHRRQGAARGLLAEAESWLSTRGVKEIRARVAAPNESALKLYRACEYSVGLPIGVLRPNSAIPVHGISKRI